MGETKGKLGLILMGRAILSKSLIQFSVDGWGCVASLLFDLRTNYGGGNEENGNLLQNVPCTHCYTQCPQPCSRPPLTHASTGNSWTLPDKSRSVSCGVTAPFSWVLVPTRFYLCPPRIYFPVLYKIWQLYGGVNDDLLQEGLCHTQVCCTQSPCPCSRPPLTRTSTGDAQTQFCLSLCEDLCEVPGSWCTQSLYEPSERLWREWGLILNVNVPLPLSCLAFSFVLGGRVSPHSCSRAYRLTGVSLTLDVGYLLTAGPAKRSHSS